MNRRSFLNALPLVPVIAFVSMGDDRITRVRTAPGTPGVHPAFLDRVSTDKDEAGYREWCIACGDSKTVKVYLDGEEVKHCEAADAQAGWARRAVETPEGNIAYDRIAGRVLIETMRGFVTIEVT